MSAVDSLDHVWADDLLDRKGYAIFLSNYVARNIFDKDGALRSISLALDAEWGVGKSFFIERWRQTLETEYVPHLTLIFDAWSEDFGDDPLMALLAAFSDGLENGQSRLLPEDQILILEGKAVAADYIERGKRAIFPVFKLIGKALFKKAIGVGLDQVADCIDESDGALKSSPESSDDHSEKLVEAFLEDRSNRKEIIEKFKNDVSELLNDLVSRQVIKLPMYVFIDELDRCRPDYAIKLLEGVKHIFGVPGVCFVVSTNLQQLACSVKAIYGESFEGWQYLKRFFDFEYKLPEPDRARYIKYLAEQSSVLKDDRVWTGLHLGPVGSKSTLSVENALSWVFDAFKLDLRSINRVVALIDAASSGVPRESKIHVVWMAFLCCVRYKYAMQLSGLIGTPLEGVDDLRFLKSYSPSRIHVKFDFSRMDKINQKNFKLIDVIKIYIELLSSEMNVLSERLRGVGDQFVHDVCGEIVRSNDGYKEGGHIYPRVRAYIKLVELAGHME